MKMNVSFKENEVVLGTWKCVGRNGLTQYVFQNLGSGNRIVMETTAGEGVNYSKIIGYYDNQKHRSYSAMRYLYKWVSLAQNISNVLYGKWQESPEISGWERVND